MHANNFPTICSYIGFIFIVVNQISHEITELKSSKLTKETDEEVADNTDTNNYSGFTAIYVSETLDLFQTRKRNYQSATLLL